MFLHDTDKAQAVLFFGKEGISKELLYPELEALLEGFVPLEEWANSTQKAAYVEFNHQFVVTAAVFFTMAFDAKGAVDSGWNLPLLDMARTTAKGPDLGAGAIRIACASQCPIAYFKDWLWDPDMDPEGPQFKQIKRSLKRNRLGVHFRSTRAADDSASGFSAQEVQHLEAHFSQHFSKQYEKALREQMSQFQRIVAWSGRTRMGDLAEVEALPEDSPLLPLVTSTADNCLGSECPMWNECFVVQARQRAQSADLVVVNHHLLLADLALKQEGFGEILPGAQAFVVDEAHQLPELAAQFFGESLSARPLVELARDALGECKDQPGALAVLQQPVRELEHATRALRATMEGLPNRGTRDRALHWPAFDSGLEAVSTAVAALRDALAPLRESSPGFDACHARAQENTARLDADKHGLGKIIVVFNQLAGQSMQDDVDFLGIKQDPLFHFSRVEMKLVQK